MTPSILIFIAIMWLPIALLLLGHGEIVGTGWAASMVGVMTLIGATIQAAVFNDLWTAGLLYIHGFFYLMVGWSFMTQQKDLRPMGNVALTTCFGSIIYCIVWLLGGPVVDGTPLVAKSLYLALAAAVYAILTFEVFLNAYGKLSGKILGYSLILGVVLGLWIPAFWLLLLGKLPF